MESLKDSKAEEKGSFLDLSLVMSLEDEEEMNAFFAICRHIDNPTYNLIMGGATTSFWTAKKLGLEARSRERVLQVIRTLLKKKLLSVNYSRGDLQVNPTVYQAIDYVERNTHWSYKPVTMSNGTTR